ncbi:hypothetical protein [Streptomyces sp. NPDC059651]|uniref:hypothetical protein n=1 Tax=Streptomyces sp. NPDC059651 TaxID=3346897 RepID=UPI0036CB58E2
MIGRVRLAATFSLLGLLVSGCANGGVRDRGAATPMKIPKASGYYQGLDIVLPLDEYALKKTERQRFKSAVYVLSSECMKGFGLDWPKPVEQVSEVADNSRRYGVVNEGDARKFGYAVPLPHGVTRKEALRVGRENIERTRNLPRETINLYTGENLKTLSGRKIPEGGCRGEAYRKLGLPPQGLISTTLDAMRYGTWESSRNDRIVVDAVIRWKACMRNAGYKYDTPEDAVGDRRWQHEGDPSGAEKSTAVADVKCKRNVLFVEKWHRVEVEKQKRLIKEKKGVLDGLKRETEALGNRIDRVPTGA